MVLISGVDRRGSTLSWCALLEDSAMNHKESLSGVDTWKNTPFSMNPSSNEIPAPFSSISSLNQQKWEDSDIFDYDVGMESQFREFNQASESQSSLSCKPNDEASKMLEKVKDQMMELETLETYRTQDWDPRATLNNLSFLEQKIHHLQDLVHVIVGQRSQVTAGLSSELVFQQQQLITADLTSIIIQLVSTAGSLLPSARNPSSGEPLTEPLGSADDVFIPAVDGCKFLEPSHQIDHTGNEGNESKFSIEEHDLKDEDDADEGENLPLGSYEILQLEKEEILAPHTHFCTICGKGFKRDANLRMHMRGHGDEYKTPAALAKPVKEPSSESVLIKRYSCPYNGCKRNRDHKKFQPLKTILCVKNHYKRTHCDKSYTCSKCNTKKFSVIADLKTHEKHCGKDKWLCSCGTTFSRKDKLFGHIALFQGHTPAIVVEESKGIMGSTSRVDNILSKNFSFGSNGVENMIDVKGVDDPTSYYSPLNFDPCNIPGFHEFPRPTFNDSENSFSYLLQGSKVKN